MPIRPAQLQDTISINIPKSANTDPFGRLRISQGFSIFELMHTDDNNPLETNELLENGAISTYLPNESAILMTVTDTVGSKIIRQSRRYLAYQAGKGLAIFCTGIISPSNITKRSRIGFFDDVINKTVGIIDGNGYFFEYDRGTVYVVRRTFTSGSQVDFRVDQANWNIDKMDGTGVSGITADWTKTQIFAIDMQWLGVGLVRFGVDIDGVLYYVHEFKHANILTTVHISRARLPIRYEFETVEASGGSASIKQICASVASEGGYDPIGKIFGHDLGGIVTRNATTTESPIIAVRARSIYNRITLNPIGVNIGTGSNTQFKFRLYYGVSSVTGGAWVTSNAFTGVEKNVSFTAFTGGYMAHNETTPTTIRLSTVITKGNLTLGSAINGEPDILVLTAQSYSGTAAIFCELDIQEIK